MSLFTPQLSLALILPTPEGWPGGVNLGGGLNTAQQIKYHKFYSHNGQCVRVCHAARSNQERALRSAVQPALGVGAVALHEPGLLVKMRHWSDLGTTGHTAVTVLNEAVQTLVTFTSV